jgi:DNA repair protein RadA/Sms
MWNNLSMAEPTALLRMAKAKPAYVCQSCGVRSFKWAGQCDDCRAWNSLIEESNVSVLTRSPNTQPAAVQNLALIGEEQLARRLTHISELDRALGGGLVLGSVVLLGGEPGIGKSTLTIQATAALSKNNTAAYISGEESAEQIRLRAHRLGLGSSNLQLITETNLSRILTLFETTLKPDVVIIDSIQTMWLEGFDGSAGTLTQLLASTQALVHFAKQTGTAVILIGHVTKDGQIAGPNTIAHMVDAVMHFEGSSNHQFRILRVSKNRYGAADEIGVFEMNAKGLEPVLNPSSLFLGEAEKAMSGAAIFAAIEGTRPLLVEIQALTTPTHYGQARRAAVGCDPARLSMLLAVLEARAGLKFSGQDVYLNIAGGLRITDPAADLAISAALISTLLGKAWDKRAVFFGEVSLSGAVRPAARSEARLKEAKKLGWTTAISAEDSPLLPHSKKIQSINDLRLYLG